MLQTSSLKIEVLRFLEYLGNDVIVFKYSNMIESDYM